MSLQPRFAADEMLGTLARWLRIMGYDTNYVKDRGDDDILQSAQEQGRVLLTRDEELAGRAAPLSLYILSDDIDAQLRQVVDAYQLAADEAMVRCTVCNGELDLTPKEELLGVVPTGALENHQEFFKCRSCGKVYWKGSHWNNIRKRLGNLRTG